MISWEYKSSEIKLLETEKGLNAFGKDGWELIHVQFLPNVYRVIMKRPMDFDHPMVGM